jgi:Protein of unknown function (DUF3309)
MRRGKRQRGCFTATKKAVPKSWASRLADVAACPHIWVTPGRGQFCTDSGRPTGALSRSSAGDRGATGFRSGVRRPQAVTVRARRDGRNAWMGALANLRGKRKDSAMSLGLILVIILIIFLLGGFSGRFGGYGYGYGHRGIGIIGVVVIVLVVLLLMGRI